MAQGEDKPSWIVGEVHEIGTGPGFNIRGSNGKLLLSITYKRWVEAEKSRTLIERAIENATDIKPE